MDKNSLKLLFFILIINNVVRCDLEDNGEVNDVKTTKGAKKHFIQWPKKLTFGKSGKQDKSQNISNLMFIVNDLKNTSTNFDWKNKPEKIDLFKAFRPLNYTTPIWQKFNPKFFPEILKSANGSLSKEFNELRKTALDCVRSKSNDPNCKKSLESVKSMLIACKNRSLSKEDCASFKTNFCTVFPKFPSCLKEMSNKIDLENILNKNFLADNPKLLKKIAVDCSSKKTFDEKCLKILDNLKSNLKYCIEKPPKSDLECDRFKGVFCEAFPKFFCCPEMLHGKTCDGKVILKKAQ